MQLRGKVVCVFERYGTFLLSIARDPSTRENFYLPVGGGIEFGEYSVDAVRREIKEELGKEIVNERLLGVSEHIFIFAGQKEHEIVFTYLAEFKDQAAYNETLTGTESNGQPIELVWITLDELAKSTMELYPNGLFEQLGQLKVV